MQQQLKDWRYVTNRKVDYSDKRVLLIDSSGNVRSAIFHMLRRLGVHNIQAASINDRVFSLISEGGFDLILLGHNGSDTVSGIQVLEEARYRGYMKPSAGWVFMTSDASQESLKGGGSSAASPRASGFSSVEDSAPVSSILSGWKICSRMAVRKGWSAAASIAALTRIKP
jgi:CheY-like chemotaxis protein